MAVSAIKLPPRATTTSKIDEGGRIKRPFRCDRREAGIDEALGGGD
jgi:hypothetical protein